MWLHGGYLLMIIQRQHIFGTKFNAYTAAFAPIGINMVFFQFRLGHQKTSQLIYFQSPPSV
jgi:hypothetical protein